MGPRETIHQDAAGGSLRLLESPGLLLGRVEGHYSAELLQHYMPALDRLLTSPSAIGFHDWENMTSYDSACRQQMTDWTLAHRKQIAAWHILVRSKLVAMGVATASMIIGGGIITSYSDRKKFDDALKPFLPKLRGVR